MKQLKEDADDNLELVGASLMAQARVKAFKQLFTATQTNTSPKEFIAKIDKLFGRQDLELEQLKSEADIFETAKNARTFKDGRKTAIFSRD